MTIDDPCSPRPLMPCVADGCERGGRVRENLRPNLFLHVHLMFEKKITNYLAYKEDIIAVYLFGSYASGKARSRSDVDLTFLFDCHDRAIINRRLDKYLIDLSRILRKDMHLTAMNFASEELLKQIFKKGHCLIVNDSKKLAYFKMTAYSKIVNFHYYRDQFQAGIVRKVMEGI